MCPECGSANSPRGDRCYGCGNRRYGGGGGKSSRTPYLLGIGLVVVLGVVGFGAVTLLGRIPSAPAGATQTPAAIAAATKRPTGHPTATSSTTPTASASPRGQPTGTATPTPRPSKGGGTQ